MKVKKKNSKINFSIFFNMPIQILENISSLSLWSTLSYPYPMVSYKYFNIGLALSLFKIRIVYVDKLLFDT